MNDVAGPVSQKRERVQRVLMLWGALILFALGLLLLIMPGREQGPTSDNEVHRSGTAACDEYAWL